MRQSYNLDGLVDYGTDIVPDATMVVNPAYRTVDGQARKRIGDPLANTSSDLAVRHLCAELNTTETLFPGTELRLIYDLVSSKNL
jgi:hypothetical protein